MMGFPWIFLRLNNIPLYVFYLYIKQLLYSFIQQWYLGYFHVFAIIINDVSMNMKVQKSFCLFLFPLDTLPKMELLDHKVVTFLKF